MNGSKQLVNNIDSRGGTRLDLHVKYMGIRKTHFPCRKPFVAIRLSHFSRIRLYRVSHSLPGATTEERLRPTSFDFTTHTPASCRSYQVFDLFDMYSKHSSDFWDVHSSSLGSRIASGFVCFAARRRIPSPMGKKHPTSSAYSCSNEDREREKKE